MEKLDLFKLHKDEYVAAKRPQLVDVSMATYLAIDGVGAPGESEFIAAIEALYGVAYTVKMTRKKQGKGDYVVCKLECVYQFDEGTILEAIPQDQWQWRLMIRTPECVESADLFLARQALLSKKKTPKVADVQLKQVELGPCIQMLHIGAYEDELRTVNEMIQFAQANNLKVKPQHCEVYISDPRRVPPERLKTILRLPVFELK
ncbi:GyrI-like domain-containing protein [Teredinibacter sp. KSP-S5-2]|uniref:GyrI-like domain-containing protein n=1 Tax=Teredinibacter sp. KSP-S5-2 TaxID=3034506 RepID=UPI002934974E|nr:GyrI-like domain-containing protein [Teredinibacter sp. KSP-S5-2]WNO11137.1 GyrI-like domain-containing protein [Teredinibacter sp. KSP-S5-2]